MPAREIAASFQRGTPTTSGPARPSLWRSGPQFRSECGSPGPPHHPHVV